MTDAEGPSVKSWTQITKTFFLMKSQNVQYKNWLQTEK